MNSTGTLVDEIVIRLTVDTPDILERIESILQTVEQPKITEQLDRIEESLAKICAVLEQERGDEVRFEQVVESKLRELDERRTSRRKR